MAIAIDSVTNGGAAGPVSSLTFSHTVTSDSFNRIIVVGATVERGLTVSSITYGGQGLTLVISQTQPSNTDAVSYLYYLVDPPTGTNDVVVSVSGGTGFIGAGSISFTEAHQTDPIDGTSGAGARLLSTSSISTTHTTSYDNSYVVNNIGIFLSTGGIVSVAVMSGETSRWGGAAGDGNGKTVYSNGATEQAVTAGNTTTGYTWTNQSADGGIVFVTMGIREDTVQASSWSPKTISY